MVDTPTESGTGSGPPPADLLALRGSPLSSLVAALRDEVGRDDVVSATVAGLVELAVDETVRQVRQAPQAELAAALDGLRRFLAAQEGRRLASVAPAPAATLAGLQAVLTASATPDSRGGADLVRRSWGGHADQILRALAEAPEHHLPRSRLRTMLELEQSHLSHILRDLEAAQLVERIPVTGSRTVDVHLGRVGRELASAGMLVDSTESEEGQGAGRHARPPARCLRPAVAAPPGDHRVAETLPQARSGDVTRPTSGRCSAPVILSFYSYKGGVGRTSLAVETAARLATGGFVESAAEPARPHRVLLWDLDLEAPGIAHFPVLRDLAGRAGAGTADLLRLLWQPPGAPRDDISAPEPVEIRQVLEQAIVPETAVTGGALGVLFPAASGVHPGEALAELELSTLFGPEGTAPPLLALVAQLAEEELGYEFVVVDARTGINDLAASATAALADAAVLVLRLDSQDIDNVARVADSIDRAWQRPGAMTEHRLLRVATMVPSDGGETRAAVEERRCQLDELKLAPHVELPLRPLALVREAVPTLENLRFDTRTTEAFEEVAAWARETWVDLHSSAARVSGGTRSATDRRRRGAAAAAAGRRFEEEVADLLHLGGWRTTVDVAMTGGQIDIVAEKQGEFGQRQVMLVECKSGVSGGTLNDVEKLDCRADDAGREHGVVYTKMLVARRFAGNAHRVAQLRGVLLATPADLLNAQAPAEPVRRRALRAWEGTAVERQYVEPHAVMLDDDGARRGSRRSLEGLAADWLGGVEQGLLAVLGDAGAGKSTFCRRLAYTMAKGDDRDTGSRERPLPLVVDLKSAGTVALTIDGMLTHALRSDADVDAVRLAPWRQRLREGSLVLLVDGFDEVLGYSDPAQMERLLGELREAATAGRVILTSRTSYFRSHHDATTAITGRPRLVSSEQATSYWRAIGDVADVRAVEIMPFDDRQIEQFLTRRLQPGSDVGAVLRRLRGLHPVDDLLRQPYLLVLVSDSVEGWERTKWPAVLTLAALYEAYAEHWLQRDSVRHAMLRTADAADLASGLIEHLARTMWSRPSAQMTTRELRAAATAWVGEHVGRAVSPDEEDRLEAEVRTALFLVRDEAGAYRFAHRSFMEFFIAKGLARVLATSSDELGSTTEEVAAAFDLVNLSPEILRFLQGWPQSWDAAPAAARSILTSPYRARTSENALLLGYWHGRFSHAQGPVDLLPGGVAQLAGAALAGIDLAGAVLRGADLTGADLTRVLLDTAVLAGATMRNASCDNAQFAGPTCLAPTCGKHRS